MHAWDCRCGTRNAPQFVSCRNCGAPASGGQIVPALPAGSQVASTNWGEAILGVLGWLGIALFVWLFFFKGGGCTSTQSQGTNTTGLQVTDHRWSSQEQGVRSIVGMVVNHDDRQYSYVQVEINLYNGDTQVGSTIANVNNLEPKGRWFFEAHVSEAIATRYEIKGVSGW